MCDTSRLSKVGDALSQLVNVALLPRHRDTTANESVSARAHREGWRAEAWIDALFFWQSGHCRQAYARDLARAYDYLQAARKTFPTKRRAGD